MDYPIITDKMWRANPMYDLAWQRAGSIGIHPVRRRHFFNVQRDAQNHNFTYAVEKIDKFWRELTTLQLQGDR